MAKFKYYCYNCIFVVEIQQLMACLAYCKSGLHNSPYSSLLDPINWIEICELFTRDACGLLGLSLESPLEVCVTAGCLALPSLLQIKQVMQQRQCSGVWTCKEELPVSIVFLKLFIFLNVRKFSLRESRATLVHTM